MARYQRGRRAEDQGFTLVELLVVMMLLGVVGTLVTSVVVSASKAAVRNEDQTRTLNQAKVAMERMTRDIRGANSLTSASHNSVALVSTVGSTRRAIEFRVTRGTGTQEIIRIERSTDLVTGVTTERTTRVVGGLAIGRSESVFGYLTAAGGRIKDPLPDGTFTLNDAEIRAVGSIRVTVRIARNKGNRPIELKQVVSIRNLEG